jgi:hypothetical protein
LSSLLLEIFENLPDEVWDDISAQKDFIESLISLENRTCERLRNKIKLAESTDTYMQLRLDIHILSKRLLFLQKQSQSGQMDSNALFHEILDARQKLMEYYERLTETPP